MPQYNEYERNGRRLMVEFTCRRCKGVRIEPLEKLEPSDGYGSYLHNLKIPDGWTDTMYNDALLCPTCTKGLKDFFNLKNQQEAQQ